jgi:uncharacterized protein
MKPSAYNYSTVLADGTRLLYNFYTLSLAAFRPKDAGVVADLLADPDPPGDDRAAHIRDTLVQHGFLIDDEVDERAYLTAAHQRAAKQRSRLSLTIAPTLACNFRCAYCYEPVDGATMAPEVEAALETYVRRHLRRNGSLSITWFGGEPLMRLATIERLSAAFISLCEKRSAAYSASIITNGSLLTADAVDRLVAARVTEAQVTLDGPEEVHNRRRPLRTGGATFAQILANLPGAAEKLAVSIRMNVDETNRESVLALVDRLSDAGLAGRTGFYLGQTYPYTATCSDVAATCLSDADYSLLSLETSFALSQRGIVSFKQPAAHDLFCMADSPASVAVTPSGGLVKCWNQIGDPAAEAGHLLKPSTAAMRRTSRSWQRDPFEGECGACMLLPMCMGGCPYLRRLTGTPHCHEWRHHPNENLLFYYYARRLTWESDLIRKLALPA